MPKEVDSLGDKYVDAAVHWTTTDMALLCSQSASEAIKERSTM
jgi:hypothetical protein